MAKEKPDTAEGQQAATAAPLEEEHLDDFLNQMEATEGKRELLAAFAANVKRKREAVKRTRDEWLAAFHAFENDIPR